MTVQSIAPADAAERDGASTSKLLSWFSSVDHKQIGILYICTALVFLLVAGLEAVVIRVQLAVPYNTLVGPRLFNQLFTMHGTTMVFLVGMPILTGFANYFVPLMIGARDVSFPRLNAFAYWLVPFGGILLHYSFLTGSAPNAGWFNYAPLSERAYSSLQGVDYWLIALLVLGIRSNQLRHHQPHRHDCHLPGSRNEHLQPRAALRLDDVDHLISDHSGDPGSF